MLIGCFKKKYKNLDFTYFYLTFAVASVIHSTSNSINKVDVTRFPQGYIVSHSKYDIEPYLININSTLLLTGVQQQQQITLNLVEIKLRPLDYCLDYLSITYNSNSTKLCKKDQFDNIGAVSADANQITLQFVTVRLIYGPIWNRKGFLLFYSGKSTALMYC